MLTKQGYDLLVDNVGTPASLHKQADAFLKPSGTFVQVGATPSLQTAKTFAQRGLLPGFLGGGSRKWKFMGKTNDKEGYARILALMAEGKVRTVIGETFGFSEVPAAYAKLKTGSGVGGKIVVEVVKG